MELTSDDEIGDTYETGCMFLPGCAEAEDEGPTDKLDLEPYSNPSSPPSGSAPPTGTPPSWTYHSGTATYYRLASEFELEEHGWPEGTTLFSAANVVDALTNGTDSPVTLAIPISYYDVTGGPFLDIQTLTVQRRRTMNDAVYVTSRDLPVGPLVETYRPEFHLFLPSWVDLDDLGSGIPGGTTLFAALFGDSHGGVSIQGMTPDQDFSILGPSSGLWLESPPPGTNGAGVLVSKPHFHDTEFDDVLAHWFELADEACAGDVCTWEEDDDGLPPANCGDQIDNDADCAIDGADWFCKHRSDHGCNNFDPHNHRWENSKDFAVLPDIEWCTRMDANEMPWHSEVYSVATLSAHLLNAIEFAVLVDPNRSAPPGIPKVNYRFAYCVFADSIDDAVDCIDDEEACPADYQVGGVSHELDDHDTSPRNAYFRALWDEFDVAMHKAEAEGITPKPVAMVSAIFSGEIKDTDVSFSNLINSPVGLAASIGHLDRATRPDLLGASTVETDWFKYVRVAHENGHSLGLEHTLEDETGHYADVRGFMYYNTSGLPYAVLGPSEHPNLGYEYVSQWSAWYYNFPNKEIPRPNAFDHTGCSQHSQCPEPGEYCWNAGPLGLCLSENPY